MSTQVAIEVEQFLEVVQPSVANGEPSKLASAINARWSSRHVARLLRHDRADVRQAAGVALSVMGDESNIGLLTRALHDTDWRVHQSAEQALWSIWFRSCSPEAAKPFAKGFDHLGKDEFDEAIRCFTICSSIDPAFPEAHDQRGIALQLNHQYREALAAFKKTIEMMPCHFGACAGMGHCYYQMQKLEPAIKCYRRALRINPRLTAVSQAIDHLQNSLSEILNSSGGYECDFSMK